MHALIVVSNPNPSSFSAAVVEKVREGLIASGITSEVADLAREGFDPRWLNQDFEYFHGRVVAPAEIRKEQDRIDRADALIIVHPLYWWHMPGQLKGWIDRVFQLGWAYGYNADSELVGLLRDRPVHVIVHGESDSEGADKWGYRAALLTLVDGIFGFCGMKNHRTSFMFEVSKDPSIPTAHLETAYSIGSSIFAKDRSLGQTARAAE